MSTKKEMLETVTKEVTNAKLLKNNTLEINYADNTVGIRLHQTDIITIKPNGNQILNSGGWKTPTTKERINYYSNARIYQEKGVWYIGECMFYDGIEIDKNGKIVSKKVKAPTKEIAKKKKQIANYVKLITKDNLPTPNNGDCWYCSMFDKEGKQHDHLEQHIEEGYIHGSILVNAMREKGYRDEQIAVHYGMKLEDTFKRAVRTFLQKRLISNIAVK